MEGYELIIQAVVTGLVCALIITKSVLKYLGKFDALKKVEAYQGIAFKIFEGVDSSIPDDYGSHEDDPAIAKAAHKLELFTKQFVSFYEKTAGGKLSDIAISEVQTWAAHWADQQKKVEPEVETDA